MIGAHVIDAMIAAGASAEVIAAAWKADLAEQEQRMAERREKDADRQRRHRASRDVTVTERDEALPPPPPDKSPPDPQKLTPTPAHSGTQTRARKAGPFPCPEGVDPEHWADLMANRKTKRLTNTPTAYRSMMADIAKFADDEWPPGRIVEFAAARGWGAIFDPRNREQSNGKQRQSNGMGRDQSGDGIGPTARAAMRAFPDVFGPDASNPGRTGH